jgi:outer membrane protein assembly factor BamB
MCRPIIAIVAIVFGLLSTQLVVASEWSRFRGPNGTGVSETGKLPLHFGPEHNVVWKTALPPGHSSPILTDTRIFLTAFEDDILYTYCLDRATGDVVWRRSAPSVPLVHVDDRNNAASPSPAVDESGVYVFFPDFGLLAYDFDGNERWQHPIGGFDNIYGMGASPIIAGDNVVLVCDQSTESFIVALDRSSGETVWRQTRPEAKSGHSTPVLYEADDGELQIIVPGSFLLTSYAAQSGKKLWWVSGLSFEMKSTPVLVGDMIFINGYGAPENQPGANVEAPGFAEAIERDANGDGRLARDEVEGHISSWFGFVDLDADGAVDETEWAFYLAALASRNGVLGIRVGGEGDMTEQNVAWTYDKRVPQLPSPLVYEGVLYMVNDGGIVTSLEPDTGAVVAQGRLKGAVDSYYASPVAADGKIFLASELGKIAVLRPGGGLDVAALNDLDDLIYATPAIADGRIYVRTRNTLYCFGESSQ